MQSNRKRNIKSLNTIIDAYILHINVEIMKRENKINETFRKERS